MKHPAAFILCVALAAAALSSMKCKDDGVTPQDNKLNTTSHDFTWTVEKLGDGASSALYDVAIMNDTLVYAVGEIYRRDSSGNWDPHAYNFARWNGQEWELLRIQFYTVCGQSSRTPYPASSLFAFSENDIWIAMYGDQIARWDGSKQTTTICLPVSFSVKKIWGQDSNSVYVVGDGGNILHYSNGVWQELESGAGNQINDVWGIINPSTNNEEVYCAVLDPNMQHNKILRITDQTAVESLEWDSTILIGSVWTKNGSPLYACGGKLYEYKSGVWSEEIITGDQQYFIGAIRGAADNDLFGVGFGFAAHYNGRSWRVYSELSLNAYYMRVATTGSTVAIVGRSSAGGIAVIGRR